MTMRFKTVSVACTLAVALLGVASVASAEELTMVGSTTVGPIAKAFADYYMQKNPGVNVTVSESGSGDGAKALVNGTCNIANMSRFMKDTEYQACIEKQVIPVATIIALDGLAVILHPSNPVTGLKIEQIRDIYMGKITNWNEIGGPDSKIVVISRDTNSGTYETFEGKIMNKEKMAESVETVGSNGAMKGRVGTTEAAIGYVGIGFIDETVKSIKVNDIEPTAETVKSGEYPVSRPLFMFTNGVPAMGTNLWKLTTLHLTQDGQKMVEEKGFIPVTNY